MEIWDLFLRRGEQFSPKDWSKIQVNRSIRKMTRHEEAMAFRAPPRNIQLPPIHNQGDQEREKTLLAIQNIMGAQAAVIVEQWDHIKELREQQNHLIITFLKARAPDMEGEDQIQALESAFSAITKGAKISKTVIDQKITPKTKESLRLAAAAFNKIMLARRRISVCSMSNSKGARDHLAECQPSKEFLFRPKLRELAKALKEEVQFGGQSTFHKKFPPKSHQRGERKFGSVYNPNRQFSGSKASRGGKSQKTRKPRRD